MAPTFSDYITFRIIKLLPLGQIFECRKLNRKLKKSIDNQTYDELICVFRQFDYGNWYQTKEPFLYSSALKISKIEPLFLNETTKNKFRHIQRLSIFNFPFMGELMDPVFINFYKELKHLEIKYLNLKNGSKLILNELEVLSITQGIMDTVGDHKIFIKAPNLRTFSTYDMFDCFEFEHPESLESIHCFGWLNNSKWTLFVNLETLITFTLRSIEDDFLSKLINLKKVQFFENENILNKLKEQKKNLGNRDDLKIYYLGIECSQITKLPKIQTSHSSLNTINESNIDFYLDNYRKAAFPIYFINVLDYNFVVGKIEAKLQSSINALNFIKFNLKLFDLREITISRDPIYPISQLMDFLTFFKSLESLIFKRIEKLTYFNFFKELPIEIPYLVELHLSAHSDELKDYYSIILKSFKNLIYIEINKELDKTKLYDIFQRNRCLHRILIYIKPNQNAEILRMLPRDIVKVTIRRATQRKKRIELFSNLDRFRRGFDYEQSTNCYRLPRDKDN